MTTPPSNTPYPVDPAVDQGPLPDLFALPGGVRVASRAMWQERARAWRDLVMAMAYGGLPPAPESIRVESLCHNRIRRLPGSPHNWSYRIHCTGGAHPFSFCVRIIFPEMPEPVPAIINGDGCWWSIFSDEAVRRVVDNGYALVIFNRTEMAEDLGYAEAPDANQRSGGLYEVYPQQETFGALSAWAWGYHRCVDMLQELPFIEATRIAVTGHSRGGKTTLIAGATDERIALVNDNASCAGGSAAFRYVGAGGETLNIAKVFPSWFGPELRSFTGREAELPFDQHCLLAAIAPRPLLMTYALDDRWSNPEGMVQCAWAAGEAYRFAGVPDHIAYHLRPGGHAHAPEDWNALLDFAGWKWKGRAPSFPFNRHPYSHLKPAFSWKAPAD